jgi:starch phosphorylase
MESNDSLFFTDSETLESYSLSNQFSEHMEFILAKNKVTATPDDVYYSLSMAIRDRLVRKWMRTQYEFIQQDTKRVFYLSLEYLMGRLLGDALINMDFYDECRDILRKDDYILEDIMELEHDMGLGNGGLGRLAACYLDSMATLDLPAFGYGIRYEYGIFKQEIVNGRQVEQPDNWLSYGNPWEILRRDLQYRVQFFGKVVNAADERGNMRFKWIDTEDVHAVAYDVPVPGFRTETVNNLRLWQAKGTREFNFREFNQGNYVAAVESKSASETISKVLYPNDSIEKGKLLRLKQQYFFVSASLQDIIRKHKINHDDFSQFSEKNAVQLNDTHPVIGAPELMRILMDEEGLGWDEAWEITSNTFAYTNHTVVPEALEEWSVSLIERLLPRHMQIIYEINRRWLEWARAQKDLDDATIAELSIIREGDDKRVKMSNLAIVCSHTVNGVAELHTDILKNHVFKHFHALQPDKFVNVTNGITPRRWLRSANRMLSEIISERIGDDWITDLPKLREIEKFADDRQFRDDFAEAKWLAKRLLANHIEEEYGVKVSPVAMFDAQIKRFHEYKRQLLNVMHAIRLYVKIKEDPNYTTAPRVVMFGGKSAPAYTAAKLIIKLVNNVADVVNNDPDVGDKLKVVFLKNYSVTLAEKIIPASDLSEQISAAGFEASGTGNMKFALNGALTIGTMDGANIEIREEVGDENIFIFGLLADEARKLKADGYDPMEYYRDDDELRRIVDMIEGDYFSRDEPGIFQPVVDSLKKIDYYWLFADYRPYVEAQERVAELYLDQEAWIKKAILNVARSGKFSSDRSVRDYAEKIWNIKPFDFSSNK